MRHLIPSISLLCLLLTNLAFGKCNKLSFSTINPPPFGTYNPKNDNKNIGNFVLSCTGGAPKNNTASITISYGQYSSQILTRNLANTSYPTLRLPYNIYKDPGYSQVWSSTTGTPVTLNNGTTNIPFYGKISAGYNVPAGQYTDSMLATITF